MMRLVGCVLGLTLAVPAAWAEDDPKKKDTPATPAEQVKAIQKEYQEAMAAYQEAMQGAKTPQDRQKIAAEKMPKPEKFVPRYIEIAEKHSKDPAAFDALVAANTAGAGRGDAKLRSRVLELLARDHVQNEKLAALIPQFANGYDTAGANFLRAIVEKNPNKAAKSEAMLGLAQRLQQSAMLAGRMKEEPTLAKQVETALGKGVVEDLQKTDVTKAENESAAIYKEIAEKYLSDLKVDRVVQVCMNMSFSGSKASEGFLRCALEKDSRDDVKGVATVSLAQVLKSRANDLSGKEADALIAEAEKLFEVASTKYAEVKMGFRGTVGAKAKTELFDIRFLAVGKPAPDIEGLDQDGKSFKLSDYKGKVVLLDFWSEF